MTSQQVANILLVDDQPGKLLTYRAILEELNANLISAATAKEALAILVKTDIAVILLDVCLPDIDGFELATIIRQHPRHEKTAIIFISGVRLSQEDLVRGYKIGAVDYVPVPVEPVIIRSKVQIFVELYKKTALLRQVNEALEARVAMRTQELASSNDRLTLAAEAARFASYEFDCGTKAFAWSENASELLRRPPDSLSSLDAVVDAVHADDRAGLRHRFTDLIGHCRPLEFEFRLDDRHEITWLVDRGRIDWRDPDNPRILGTILDITHRKSAEEHKTLLMSELDHRVKNVLANVSAIARLSSTGVQSVNSYVSALQGRLHAMSKAHDLLRGCDWRGAPLHDLVGIALEPFSISAASISVEGESVVLAPRVAQAVALALHELATNAVKHGALSISSGRVTIRWQIVGSPVPRFVFTWSEQGGPPVNEPSRRGFGLTVLKSAASDAGSKSTIAFEPSGFRYVLECPLPNVDPIAFSLSAERKSPENRHPSSAFSSKRVLIVEDEVFIALQLSDDLKEQGHQVVGPAASLEEGLELAQNGAYDCALIDVSLGKQTSGAIAEYLKSRNVPFAVATGFNERHPIEPIFQNAPRLSKPYEAIAVNEMVRRLCTSVAG